MDALADLKELQHRRTELVKSMNRLRSRACALARRALGWSKDLPEKDRNRLNKAAAALVQAIVKGTPTNHVEEAEAIAGSVLAYHEALVPLKARRRAIEKDMTWRAEQLAVWEWGKDIRGFGALSLAQIIGESGDLNNFPDPSHLWSYFCLGVENGKPQTAASHQRKSIMWNVADCLVKLNNDGYRRVYDARKAYEHDRAPDMSDGYAHNRAKRYLSKRVLRNLWRAWRACTV